MGSWFSNLFERAQKLLVAEGEDYYFEQLSSANAVPFKSEPIERDKDYITITLNSARIVAVRKLVGKFHASVQSRVHYRHETAGEVELQRVIAPNVGNENAKDFDRIIVVNKPIVGPVPLVGDLSLELGLFSVKGGDLAGPYIELLTTLAQTAGVGMVTAAMPYVEPLRKGADLLFGNADQSTLEVGVDTSWKASELTTGIWLVMRAPKNSLKGKNLKFDYNDGKVTESDGTPYKKFPYLVFSITKSQRRDDWMDIPELKASWTAIADAFKKAQMNEAEERFAEFRRLVQWSPDLVPADRARLIAKAMERLTSAQTTTVSASASARSLASFEDLNLYDDPLSAGRSLQ